MLSWDALTIQWEIINSIWSSNRLVSLPARCPRLFHHHLLAMKLLNSCNTFLIKILVLIHPGCGGIHDRITGLVLCWLCCRCSRHFKTAICAYQNVLLCSIRFRTHNRGLFVRSGCEALRYFGWIDSMIVVAMMGPWISVLIKVHQYVLNLGLLRGWHNHDDGGCIMLRGHKAWGRSTRHWLMAYEFALRKMIVSTRTSVLSIESLRVWTSSSLFGSCL